MNSLDSDPNLIIKPIGNVIGVLDKRYLDRTYDTTISTIPTRHRGGYLGSFINACDGFALLGKRR